MNKQPDTSPSLFHRLTRHWGKIVSAFFFFGFVLFGMKIYREIENDGSATWPEGSICSNNMFLQIRAGMSHADVFRQFPVADGFRINKIFDEYLSQVLESGDAKRLGFKALEGNLVEEEWVIEKEGSGADARIWFNAEGQLVGKDCGYG